MDNILNSFSANLISKYFKSNNTKIDDKTIQKYTDYIEESCLIIKAEQENIKRKEILTRRPKYYLTDHGFKLALNREFHKDIGKIIENIVFLELLRHDYKVTVGKIKNYEIDFIARKNKKKVYIQVSYKLSNENIINREFRPLQKINNNFRKYVISCDSIDYSHEGITHMNIIDFLTDFIE